MELTYQIVRRLFRDGDTELSRNKNFSAYEDPMVRRARRIWRHLASVEQDLLQLDDPTHAQLADLSYEEDGAVRISLVLEEGRATRRSALTLQDWQLLLENEAVRQTLDALIERADPEIAEVLGDALDLA